MTPWWRNEQAPVATNVLGPPDGSGGGGQRFGRQTNSATGSWAGGTAAVCFGGRTGTAAGGAGTGDAARGAFAAGLGPLTAGVRAGSGAAACGGAICGVAAMASAFGTRRLMSFIA